MASSSVPCNQWIKANIMFYFHGAKGGNFAIVSDENLHINVQFIGTRPEGRTRDFTWIQAIAIMFDSHTLVIGAKRVFKWDDKVDALMVKWNGESVDIPEYGGAEWVRSIGEKEDRHHYHIPADDTFAHLETQFTFSNLSDLVEGVLGKTYRPGYVSRVKRGVPMPLMGGEDKYKTPSLFSPLCKVCSFQTTARQSGGLAITTGVVA
ncbi:PREDICTED: uncharacterized protein LOC101296556 [Fragaria vesca subsp. vesca]|uniref:uncharacterized protein LOC101296556 n=1 Tax=Fragaria vesca subsp. vesca TaxID=101020 RepID=UPI0002C2F7F7|nr:PREDICTED: uncharacterized protein LOC101296556 [Fragaria vesca subsp. vesca]